MSSMHIPFGFPAVQAQHAQLAQIQQAQLQGPAQVLTPSGSLRNCVRLRGMPYSATVEDIIQFLGDLSIGIFPNGIHLVLNPQGRPSGDAFVQMTTPESAALAALDVNRGGCHKKHMRERYVEVFQCSRDEMNVVLMGGTMNKNGVQPPSGMSSALTEQQPLVVQHPPVATPIQQTYALPGTQPTLMIHPSQIPLEFLSSQAPLFPTAIAGRHVLAQPTLLPYAYFPTPPVSPSVPGQASAVHTLATGPRFAQPLALPQHAHPFGIQVRMQGVPYNPGVSDILTLIKAQQPNTQYATSTTVSGEEIQGETSGVVSSQPNDWTYLG